MAKKTELGRIIVHGYYIPLRHAHSTFKSITERLEKNEAGLGFQIESEPEIADQALMSAHTCLLGALGVQNKRFKIEGLEAAIDRCVRDWALVWTPELMRKLENTPASEK